MKHLFNPARAFASLRIVAAGACVLTAAALAFVATANNNSSGLTNRALKPTAQDSLNIPFEAYNKDAASKEEASEIESGPDTAAREDYMHRAYPADEIDLGALINAQAGLQNFLAHATPTPVPTVTPGPTDTPPPTATPTATPRKKRGGKRGKATPTPTPDTTTTDRPSPPEPSQLPFWQEVTGNTSQDPNILTFTGSTQNVSGRITALALDTHNGCTAGFCRVWVGAAGGGIWVTFNALAASPTWAFVSGFDFVSNAIGAITFFDNGSFNGVLYVGTGEPNASGDSEAGVGVYRSTDGGNTWALLPANIGPITSITPGVGANGTYTGDAFLGRSVSSIVVDPTNPQILYVSSARGVRGVSSVTGGATSNPTTPRPPYGLFKSVDGGNTFSFIFDGDPTCGPGTCLGGGPFSSIRGDTEAKLDPSNHNIVYTSVFPGVFGGGGVFRSTDGGSTWAQILAATDALNVNRCAFDVTDLGGGVTRMYAGCGSVDPFGGGTEAHVFRSNNAQGAATFTDLTALEPPVSGACDTTVGFAINCAGGFTRDYCTGQCWYDNFVYTPPGFPNVVYVGGSFRYDEYAAASNGRGVVMTQDGQDSPPLWNDMTWDAQNNVTPAGSCCQPNAIAPNGIHPDQHAFFTVPGNPLLFFEGSDGGIVRTNGALTNISAQCVSRIGVTIFTANQLFECRELLGFFGGGVPNTIFTAINSGLRTLQLQSVSVASDNVNHFQFGTQDNGTWNDFSFASTFFEEIYGDGGQSGFRINSSATRFNSFFGQFHDVNFANGNPSLWFIASGAIAASVENSAFYVPLIADPFSSGTIFEGSRHIWRTQDWAGPSVFACPEFTTSGANPACGDFVAIGGGPTTGSLNTPGDLGGTFYGADRRPTTASRAASAIARTPSNSNVAWAATAGGRVFVSDNVDTATPASVVWNRVDADIASSKDPTRFPSWIFIDPANSHHAWISYSGYNFNTPSQPGHVFSVTWDGVAGDFAVWTDISFNIWDIPITSVVFDPVTGDLYASSDFVVFRLAASNNPARQWFLAGLNMPMVETAGLTIIPGARVLYAATHGRGVWQLTLP